MFGPEFYRLSFFIVGLSTLMVAEQFFPHHLPTVSRRGRWLTNLSLTAVNSLTTAGVCALCLLATVSGWVPWQIKIFPNDMSLWLRIPLEVAILDLCIYWQHRLFHIVPVFWRFHEVHHTDRDLDVTSASRFHVGEILTSALLKLAVVLSIGISITGLLAFEIAISLAAQFQHSNIRLPSRVEQLLWYFVVPPAMHRVHHCPMRRHHDRNFGTLLTVWDRVFGSLAHPLDHSPTFGLEGFPASRRLGLLSLIILPFRMRRPDRTNGPEAARQDS
jgi:sterol desaturase/sphingolipid hydroxylase (fatty acid hydroxylase superfamily)